MLFACVNRLLETYKHDKTTTHHKLAGIAVYVLIYSGTLDMKLDNLYCRLSTCFLDFGCKFDRCSILVRGYEDMVF